MPFAPANWALKVGGLVARPSVFSLEQLKRMPRTEHASAPSLRRGMVGGRRLARRAAERDRRMVGASRDAQYVEFRSFDAGYCSSWDIESSLHPQTILAYGMNGHPLYPDHGAPLRLYSPVKLGYKNVKYLTEVNFLPTTQRRVLGRSGLRLVRRSVENGLVSLLAVG